MDPGTRSAILLAGLVFCVALLALTVTVVVRSGPDVLSLASVLVIAMVGFGLIGALRNPPR